MKSLKTIGYLLSGMTLLNTVNVYAVDLFQQRQQFTSALAALETQDWESFQQLTSGLEDYPLYYYLRYQYLKPQLSQLSPTAVENFLQHYGDSHFGQQIRQGWLKSLAEQGDWNNFIRLYDPNEQSADLQCYYVQARLSTGQQTQAAIEDAKQLWMVDHSQSANCTASFEYLIQNQQITDDMTWERIRLAMKKNRITLARTIAKRLSEADQEWVKLWQTMHQKPEATLAEFNHPDNEHPIVRDIILHGIKQLAKKQFDTALTYWENFQRRYAFSVPQIGEMQRDLASASLQLERPDALKWLTAVNKDFLTPQISDSRLKLALQQQNWSATVDFINQLPENEKNNFRSRYWLGRALEQLGKTEQAQEILRQLATERDYYAFLAADHLSVEYQMQHRPIKFTPTEQALLMKKLSLKAAQEFFQLSQMAYDEQSLKWLGNAQAEWQYAMKRLPPSQQAIAAALANRWGWYDQALATAGKANYYDDLEVRFPLAFYNDLNAGARNQDIDLAWVYGIVRQESAFKSHARSSAGALGLMQLMPATGRWMAKKLGLEVSSTQDILEVSNNISLGTGYLRQVLDQFDGNYMLATAAYNAGPNRAERWATEKGCIPADIWVELIPFSETQKYVRSVLFYTAIFESRLGRRPRPIRIALPQIECASPNYTTQQGDKSYSNTPG
jgi:soluble lytic murein transglycosylase